MKHRIGDKVYSLSSGREYVIKRVLTDRQLYVTAEGSFFTEDEVCPSTELRILEELKEIRKNTAPRVTTIGGNGIVINGSIDANTITANVRKKKAGELTLSDNIKFFSRVRSIQSLESVLKEVTVTLSAGSTYKADSFTVSKDTLVELA